MTEQRNYLDYDPDATRVQCTKCSWHGLADPNAELFREFLEVRCPKCNTQLLIVVFPTLDESRAAAAAGNAKALASLPQLEDEHQRRTNAVARLLRTPGQLPELSDSALVIEWDFEQRDDDTWQSWTVLRHHGLELWREPAFYEGIDRFAEVFEMLVARYGDRLVEVRPTTASELYLYGDRLRAPRTVAALNARLTSDP